MVLLHTPTAQHCCTAGVARLMSSRDDYIIMCDCSYRCVIQTQQQEEILTEGLEEVLGLFKRFLCWRQHGVF